MSGLMSGQNGALPDGLRELLRQVSRSFYLSIQVLPAAVRSPVALGYLLARAADSIADTTLLPPAQRKELLLLLREATAGESGAGEALGRRLAGQLGAGPATGGDAERRLLLRLPECLALLRDTDAADRLLVQAVLGQLVVGMVRDLERFPAAVAGAVPPAEVVALGTLAELDEYTYFAAGCVGEFWTDVTAAHLPQVAHLRQGALRQRGVDLGKALQLVNVIRDAPADLRAGRCYWPRELLARHGVTPADLAGLVQKGAGPGDWAVREAAQAITWELHELALLRVASAWPYVLAIPPGALRLRLSCVWPLWLCLDTLAALAREGSPLLHPERPIKVPRQQVYGLMFESIGAGLLDAIHPGGGLLGRRHDRHWTRSAGRPGGA